MIHLQGVSKHYGSLVALDNLSLHIGPGELFGFIGPNGAGKSTTMKILACLLRPDTGRASVGGLDVLHHGHEIRKLVGYMPDFLGVYDDLTVDEYLQFFAAAFKIPAAKRRSIVEGVLELTDLREKRHAMVDSLSRGMQQRLGVARVLIHDPKVLLLDEPASGLDPRARIEMRELLTELTRMGKTIMVSSHILSELAEMCSSIGIIERGKLLYAGSIHDAYARAGAGQRISVTLEPGPDGLGASPERAAEFLSRCPAVARVGVEGPTLSVELAPDQTSHQPVIETLIGCGARVVAFVPRQVKLEDAFLRLTKGALN
ncbi:MAG: ABC transporter ATP-binding protein [Phycisphaerales bacterium]|nr:ABC transporter ATP-binding protein [Phycisphaerales bacterium]